MNARKTGPRPFQIAIECADVKPLHVITEVLAKTAEALCHMAESDARSGIYCLVWAATRLARQHGGMPPDRICEMIAEATFRILEMEDEEPPDHNTSRMQ